MCDGRCEFRTVIYQGKEYADLEVNKCGVMRNRESGNIYAWNVDDNGYLCAMYGMGKGKKKRMRQHRVLMETFVPNPQNKPFINHIDSNTKNNSISNLEWCTAKENVVHSLRAGRTKSGLAKLSQEDADYIRKVYKKQDKDFGVRALARKFNVSDWCIRSVINYKSWKHVGEYDE